MKTIFKFTLILVLLWIGIKSLMNIARGEDSLLSLVIDLTIFVLFVGSPATYFWSYSIDNAFNDSDENNNEQENN